MSQNRVYLGSDGFIHNEYEGDQDYGSVKLVEGESVRLAEGLRAAGRPVLILADLRRMGKSDPSSRRAAREALDMHVYDRCAIAGGNVFLRHLANFIIMASRRAKDVRFLDTPEEAAAWLRKSP
ncbi:MAG TPA: hypothetical protein VHH36_01235 [Candidatus Thermoplasmatota archaeon]|nr:hypothetical protein [Candidatus Thermoplasmatota archaeon]